MSKEQKAQKQAQAMEKFNQMCSSMEVQGYKKHNYLFSKLQVNLLAFLIYIPLITITLLVLKLTPNESPDINIGSTMFWTIFIPVLIISVVVHEYLHAIGWAFFCEGRFKSVKVTFDAFMPMCACSEPLSKNVYIFGALLPFTVLGIGSLTVMAVVPTAYTYIVSFTNLLLCGGDILIALRALKLREAKIIDHPTEPGFTAFIK